MNNRTASRLTGLIKRHVKYSMNTDYNVMQVSNIDQLTEMIANHFGITIDPESMIAGNLQQALLFPVSGTPKQDSRKIRDRVLACISLTA